MTTGYRTSFASLLMFFILFTGMAFAADLSIQVDKDKQQASITSSLSTSVTLLYLVGTDNRRLPLFSRLVPGETVQLPLRFIMPETVSYATCEIPNPPKGYEKELDNYYHLSVEIH